MPLLRLPDLILKFKSTLIFRPQQRLAANRRGVGGSEVKKEWIRNKWLHSLPNEKQKISILLRGTLSFTESTSDYCSFLSKQGRQWRRKRSMRERRDGPRPSPTERDKRYEKRERTLQVFFAFPSNLSYFLPSGSRRRGNQVFKACGGSGRHGRRHSGKLMQNTQARSQPRLLVVATLTRRCLLQSQVF